MPIGATDELIDASMRGVDSMRRLLDGVVSGTLSMKDGGSVYSVTVERDVGTSRSFTDLILPVVCGRLIPRSGCSTALTAVAGVATGASAALVRRRPGTQFLGMNLAHGDSAGPAAGLAGSLSGAAMAAELEDGATGVAGGKSSRGEATSGAVLAEGTGSAAESSAGSLCSFSAALAAVMPFDSATAGSSWTGWTGGEGSIGAGPYSSSSFRWKAWRRKLLLAFFLKWSLSAVISPNSSRKASYFSWRSNLCCARPMTTACNFDVSPRFFAVALSERVFLLAASVTRRWMISSAVAGDAIV